ncbi:DUF3606 domain-containing protein [Methylopila sp. M107]|uniref:DUF3606 domain-containing protein n=1 Tax=Methylopila sp. M107 TaxID=1101190 RepID=UPI000372E75F|nr:DUF3606 domain-containing protein [Methylopila sp. M107]
MADDLKRRGPEDPRFVNVNEDWEVRHWCAKWGVTPDELKRAVKMVGTGVAAVARHLGK